jgi:hypothetical protein
VSDQQHHVCVRTSRDHARAFVLRNRHGFFDQHMLAGARGELGMLRVQRMRRSDVHKLNVGIGDERFRAFVRGAVKFTLERRAGFFARVAGSHDLHARILRKRWQHERERTPEPDYTNANGGVAQILNDS